MSKHLRPTTKIDIEYVARHMREADIAECYAMAGAPPVLALLLSILNSPAPLTMVSPRSGNPVGICGVTPGLGGTDRRVWMLATDELEDHAMLFLRHSRTWLDAQCAEHSVLWNYVDERNHKHIAWLKWLGVQFNGSIVSPYTGSRLLHFSRTALCA